MYHSTSICIILRQVNYKRNLHANNNKKCLLRIMFIFEHFRVKGFIKFTFPWTNLRSVVALKLKVIASLQCTYILFT